MKELKIMKQCAKIDVLITLLLIFTLRKSNYHCCSATKQYPQTTLIKKNLRRNSFMIFFHSNLLNPD